VRVSARSRLFLSNLSEQFVRLDSAQVRTITQSKILSAVCRMIARVRGRTDEPLCLYPQPPVFPGFRRRKCRNQSCSDRRLDPSADLSPCQLERASLLEFELSAEGRALLQCMAFYRGPAISSQACPSICKEGFGRSRELPCPDLLRAASRFDRIRHL
jgi:hypothetical protein